MLFKKTASSEELNSPNIKKGNSDDIGINYDFSVIKLNNHVGLPVLRYTYKKLLKSPSTIFFLLIALAAIFALIIFSVNVTTFTIEKKLSLLNSAYSVAYFTVFTCTLYIIFLALKCTQVIRDEIDEGTFLVILSKPISRSSLLVQKWLAFQFVGILFILWNLLTSSILVGILIPSQDAFLGFVKNMPFILIFSLIFQLIFTSIFFLVSFIVSTKTMLIVAAIISIFLILFNTVLPLFLIPTVLSVQTGNKLTVVSNETYVTLQNEINIFSGIAIVNIAYQMQVLFNFAQQGFVHNPFQAGPSGSLSMFSYFQKPVLSEPTGIASNSPITSWKDFIDPIILLCVYGGLSGTLLFGTYWILNTRDFR